MKKALCFPPSVRTPSSSNLGNAHCKWLFLFYCLFMGIYLKWIALFQCIPARVCRSCVSPGCGAVWTGDSAWLCQHHAPWHFRSGEGKYCRGSKEKCGEYCSGLCWLWMSAGKVALRIGLGVVTWPSNRQEFGSLDNEWYYAFPTLWSFLLVLPKQ